ncbi:hypothetical protein ACE6H2_010014 [Prunus campanulata]
MANITLASRYDVASFLSYRVANSGELEVRVRFYGFSREDDEWVNVTRAVHERSIPLEASECHKVKVGDLVLCFQGPVSGKKKSKQKRTMGSTSATSPQGDETEPLSSPQHTATQSTQIIK